MKKILLTTVMGFFMIGQLSCNRTFLTPPLNPAATKTPTPAAPTFTPTGTITVSCTAQTIVSFTGNLNSAQQANQPGGILQLGTSSAPVLPFVYLNSVNYSVAALNDYQGGTALFQTAAFNTDADTGPLALPNHARPLMDSVLGLSVISYGGYTTLAWCPGVNLPPACTVTKTVTDTLGAQRQIEVLFYQCNDLGTASPPVNAGAPATQVAYAWYAFEVTGGLQPSSSIIIGGTELAEGDDPANYYSSFTRCVSGNIYAGDCLFFNSDGSLASEGSMVNVGSSYSQVKPYLYLPLNGNYYSSDPNNPQYVVELNFGTAGMPGFGKKDGVTGLAAASAVH